MTTEYTSNAIELPILSNSARPGCDRRPINGARYPQRVVTASRSFMPLRRGSTNKKMGGDVIRCGRWTGATLFYVALEEGSTCPGTCEFKQDGSCVASDYAGYRFVVNEAFYRWTEFQLNRELARNPAGVAVRLHVSGDAPDRAYVEFWERMLRTFPGLYLWGHTHHRGALLRQILDLNSRYSDRCLIRASELLDAPHSAVVVDNPEAAKQLRALLCPATQTWRDDKLALKQSSRDDPFRTCADCGGCWKESVARIAWPKRQSGRPGYVTDAA